MNNNSDNNAPLNQKKHNIQKSIIDFALLMNQNSSSVKNLQSITLSDVNKQYKSVLIDLTSPPPKFKFES